MNEIEYKWQWNSSIPIEISKFLNSNIFLLEKKKIKIIADYYDSIDHILKKNKIALRKRKENGKERCYLKISYNTSEEYYTRKEYVLETNNIHDIIDYVVLKEKDNNITEILKNNKFDHICQISFDRNCYILKLEKANDFCIVELCYDTGFFKKGSKDDFFKEIELEYIKGNDKLFHEFASYLKQEYNLKTEKLSKIARAMKI